MTDEPLIRVTAGSPTDEETAAVAAVITQLMLEQSASTLPLHEQPGVDGWQRSARGLREPLPRDRGWRGTLRDS